MRWTDHAVDLEALARGRPRRPRRRARPQTAILEVRQAKAGAATTRASAKRLKQAYRSAPTPAARTIVLDEFDDWFELDEAAARDLYEIDRGAAAFILKHLPR